MAAPNDQVKKQNGFAIRSISDVVAFATLLALFLGVCAWGLKLEARNDQLQLRVAALEARVADGILPRAEERINKHQGQITDLRRRLDKLEDRHSRNGNHTN